MLKSSGAMGVATLLSRVLGMAREVLYANFMGAGLVAGAFKLAFMIPNLFRRLLGEGALTAAFIPIFKEKEKTEGEAEMWRAANAVICGLVLAASAIIAVVVLGISLLLTVDSGATGRSRYERVNQHGPVPVASAASRMDQRAPSSLSVPATKTAFGVGATNAPSSSHRVPPSSSDTLKARFPQPGFLPDDRRLMLRLLRLMFPYMLLVCLAAIFMGMLNARGHFFLPAMGATVLNTVMIFVVLVVAPRFGKTLDTQIFALAIGVLVAGTAQTIYQVPTLWREGFRFQWRAPWKSEVVPQVVRKMIPGMMGVAAFQLNVLLTQGIAYGVDPQIFAWFDYSVRLMELPQGMFGISLATYLLPTLSGLAAEKRYPEFRSTLGQGLGYLGFGNMIASVLLVVLAEPIVRLLFEHGKFSVVDTHNVAFALACLAPGLIAFSMVNILARAFYALGDTQTPMKISTVCLALNVIFTLWLIRPLAQGGMGIANTMSALFNVWFLFYGLRRKLKFLGLGSLRRTAINMLGSSILAAEIGWITSRAWERWVGHSSFVEKVGAVFVPMGVASLIYALALLWLKTPQAQEFFGLALQRLRRK
jgi:putative peptidoglycan lipid II flippase